MIFTSPYEPAVIPEINLTDFVLSAAGKYGDKPALIDGPSGRTLTYQQLIDAVNQTAAGLAKQGFKKGDVFAIYSPNIPEYAIAFFAVSLLGGVITTINPLYTVRELVHQLKDSKAKYLLTIPTFLDKAIEAVHLSDINEVFVFGEAEGATPFASLSILDEEAPKINITAKDDLVVLPYSSGTTGFPKGVMLTHHNLVANICQIEGIEGTTADDVLIGVLPFFHIYGMLVVLNSSIYQGATIVTMPRFDLEQFLSLIEKYEVTRAHLVPPIVLGLAKHPLIDQFDLSSLKLIISGAAPLGEDLATACASRLGCVIKQGYGLTETSPVISLDHTAPGKIVPGAVGVLIRDSECKIIDTGTGDELGENQRGEVLIRGPQVMKGYLNNPEATAETIDEDGWLHTGDIGYIDSDAHLYIVDRVKELIKYKGYQVAPAELEAILLSHPSVADAAVIPSPDEEAGEVPKAFIVFKSEITQDEILGFVASRVAPYKKIRRIETIDKIPKSASGKILRKELVSLEKERIRAANKKFNEGVNLLYGT